MLKTLYRPCIWNLASGWLQIGHIYKRQWRRNLPKWRHCIFFFFFFFDIAMFLLSSLVTGLSFMSISQLVLELWQFSFSFNDWPEIRKLEIPPSQFCPLYKDWGQLGIPNLAGMFAIKCYWMLQNAKVIAFTLSELLRGNQQWVNTCSW